MKSRLFISTGKVLALLTTLLAFTWVISSETAKQDTTAIQSRRINLGNLKPNQNIARSFIISPASQSPFTPPPPNPKFLPSSKSGVISSAVPPDETTFDSPPPEELLEISVPLTLTPPAQSTSPNNHQQILSLTPPRSATPPGQTTRKP